MKVLPLCETQDELAQDKGKCGLFINKVMGNRCTQSRRENTQGKGGLLMPEGKRVSK